MADGQERTEQATPKRREEARKRGQVPKSQEVISLFNLLGAFLFLRLAGGFMWGSMENLTKNSLQGLSAVGHVHQSLMIDHLNAVIKSIMVEAMVMLAPIFVVAVAVGVIANVVQVGFMISGEALTVKLDKLDPLKGISRMLSARAFVELIKNLMKVGIVVYIAYVSMRGDLNNYLELANADLSTMVAVTAISTFNMVMKIIVALIVIAMLDYFYQRFEHEKSLKMTKQEVKDEYKQREGDPYIKARIRERMRQLVMQQMLKEVPQADVVITNPTHYAVALHWQENMPAPKVLAKGIGPMAMRIREIAEENKVMIVEDPPLAQALYKACEPGEWIPADLFRAVAKILAFVYKTKGRMPKFAQAPAETR